MAVHLSLGLSNAYYTTNNQFFGTLDKAVPTGEALYICSSGEDTDKPGSYQTWCSTATTDDSWGGSPVGHCILSLGQPNLTDGCYTPDISVAALAQAAKGVAIRATSSSTHSGSSGRGDFVTVLAGGIIAAFARLLLVHNGY